MDVYEASDGMNFLTEEECKKHEDILFAHKNLQYFKIGYNRDLNETGLCLDHITVAVLPENEYDPAYPLAFNFALMEICHGKYLQKGIMGYRYATTFEITKTDLSINDKIDVFISHIHIDGYPEPFDYKKKWNIN